MTGLYLVGFRSERRHDLELGMMPLTLVRGVGSISFLVPSGDVLDLDHILLVPSLRKNLVSVSCMINIHWIVSFE
jgi:hypothetical protein